MTYTALRFRRLLLTEHPPSRQVSDALPLRKRRIRETHETPYYEMAAVLMLPELPVHARLRI